jgi:hypothetical protein
MLDSAVGDRPWSPGRAIHFRHAIEGRRPAVASTVVLLSLTRRSRAMWRHRPNACNAAVRRFVSDVHGGTLARGD